MGSFRTQLRLSAAIVGPLCLAGSVARASESGRDSGPQVVASAPSFATARAAAEWAPELERGTDLRLALDKSGLHVDPEPPASASPAGSDSPPAADDAAELAKKLANPVASLISVPFQLNFDTGYGPKDADRVTLNIQPVIPFSLNDEWNLITRTIVPVVWQDALADGLSSDFGLGDTVQSFFFSPKDAIGGWIIGAGPVALWPTGTEPRLRTESLAFGPTLVALRQDKGWTYGVLANHLWSVTNSDDHEQVNASFIQPFVSYTWPSATTLTLNTESTYDWSTDDWNAPVNLILSQLLTPGGQPIQIAIGARYYADSPNQGAEWGLRFAVTFLFPK